MCVCVLMRCACTSSQFVLSIAVAGAYLCKCYLIVLSFDFPWETLNLRCYGFVCNPLSNLTHYQPYIMINTSPRAVHPLTQIHTHIYIYIVLYTYLLHSMLFNFRLNCNCFCFTTQWNKFLVKM